MLFRELKVPVIWELGIIPSLHTSKWLTTNKFNKNNVWINYILRQNNKQCVKSTKIIVSSFYLLYSHKNIQMFHRYRLSIIQDWSW